MARDILSEYGEDYHSPQAPKAAHGGCLEPRDVHNYKHPVGPTNVGDPKSPGLHGEVHHCGSQHKG